MTDALERDTVIARLVRRIVEEHANAVRMDRTIGEGDAHQFYSDAQELFRSALVEMREMASHRCYFDDADICQSCGADGRA